MVATVLVVKVGGRVLLRNFEGLLRDVASVSKGKDLILVHGGGDVVSEYSRRLGIEPTFITSPSGVRSRYTSREELTVYVMVMAGKLNKEVVAGLVSLGVKAVGLSGADGALLLAERKERLLVIDERGRKRVIEGGYTGKVIKVNTDLLKLLLNMGYVVVVAPLAIDDRGTLLNVDGDQVAYAIATALKADDLVLLTDVDGVVIDGEVVKEIKVNEVDELVKKVGYGMNRKLLMAKEALKSGIGRVVISSGLINEPLTNALAGKGTILRC